MTLSKVEWLLQMNECWMHIKNHNVLVFFKNIDFSITFICAVFVWAFLFLVAWLWRKQKWPTHSEHLTYEYACAHTTLHHLVRHGDLICCLMPPSGACVTPVSQSSCLHRSYLHNVKNAELEKAQVLHSQSDLQIGQYVTNTLTAATILGSEFDPTQGNEKSPVN